MSRAILAKLSFARSSLSDDGMKQIGPPAPTASSVGATLPLARMENSANPSARASSASSSGQAEGESSFIAAQDQSCSNGWAMIASASPARTL